MRLCSNSNSNSNNSNSNNSNSSNASFNRKYVLLFIVNML
jgi:hypothetical protein